MTERKREKRYTQAEMDAAIAAAEDDAAKSGRDSAADSLEQWADAIGSNDGGAFPIEVAILNWAAARLRSEAP